jgi:hypothetical protein
MTIPGVYSQRDPRWGSQELGYNTDPAFSIYHYGCAITCVANYLWYEGHPEMNPEWVNNRLKQLGGYVDGGALIWGSVTQLAPNLNTQGVTYDFNSAISYVNAADFNWAILQVTKAGFPMHFVLLVNGTQIADPWDGVLKNWAASGYLFVCAHLYGAAAEVITTPQRAVLPQVIAPTITEIVKEEFVSKTEQQYIDEEVSLQAKVTGLINQVAQLQSDNLKLSNEVSNGSAWQTTFVGLSGSKVTTKATVATNFDTESSLSVPEGVILPLGGTFIKDGVNYYRTQKSVDAGKWIGVPVTDATDLMPSSSMAGNGQVDALTAAQTLHASASSVVGGFGSFLNKLFGGSK